LIWASKKLLYSGRLCPYSKILDKVHKGLPGANMFGQNIGDMEKDFMTLTPGGLT